MAELLASLDEPADADRQAVDEHGHIHTAITAADSTAKAEIYRL
ncbi:hypothetical protein [Jiangella aurantiaca]|nr:hypothetical protein [Jiangella aurantiaca]